MTNKKLYMGLAVGSLLLTLTSFNSLALEMKPGFFFEPAVTYETGRASVSYPSPLSNSKGHANGFGLGARVGMHFAEVFFLGLDGRYSMPQYTDSSVDYNARSVSTNWGPVVGLQFPDVGIRIWGTVVLGGMLNPENSGNFDVKFERSEGFRLGAGIRLAAVSLNIEYQQMDYANTVLENLGPFTTDGDFSNVNLENKSWIASVSFPLEL